VSCGGNSTVFLHIFAAAATTTTTSTVVTVSLYTSIDIDLAGYNDNGGVSQKGLRYRNYN